MTLPSLCTSWGLSQPQPASGTSDAALALEQFATSIAALARRDESPLQALSQVVCTIVDNLNGLHGAPLYDAERLLAEKAQAYGFLSVSEFHARLLQLIAERMVDLKLSHLNVEMRQEKLERKAG